MASSTQDSVKPLPADFSDWDVAPPSSAPKGLPADFSDWDTAPPTGPQPVQTQMQLPGMPGIAKPPVPAGLEAPAPAPVAQPTKVGAVPILEEQPPLKGAAMVNVPSHEQQQQIVKRATATREITPWEALNTPPQAVTEATDELANALAMPGVRQLVRESANLTTPLNLGMMLTMTPVLKAASKIPGLVPTVRTIMGSYFATGGGREFLEGSKERKAAWDRGDYGAVADALAKEFSGALFAGAGAKEAATAGPHAAEESIQRHNVAAEEALAQEHAKLLEQNQKAAVTNVETPTRILGAEAIPVKIGDKQAEIRPLGTTNEGKPVYSVTDDAGKILTYGDAGVVKDFLSQRGAEPVAALPEEPPAITQQAETPGKRAALPPGIEAPQEPPPTLPADFNDWDEQPQPQRFNAGEEFHSPVGGKMKVISSDAKMTEVEQDLPGGVKAIKKIPTAIFTHLIGTQEPNSSTGIENAPAPPSKEVIPEKPAEAVTEQAGAPEATPEQPTAAVEPEAPKEEVKEPQITDLLATAKRKYKVGGESMEESDPRAQLILKSLTPEDQKEINSLVPDAKNPKVLGSGFDHVVVDLGNGDVMRLGSLPRHEAKSEFLPEPSVSRVVGKVGVEVYPKVDTEGITDADVKTVTDALAKKGLTWDDAAKDNLGRDAEGNLKIIDGQIKKGAPKEHDFSSTQVNLPEDIAEKVRSAGRIIPDEALAEDGREEHPHITTLYGLHSNEPADVQKVLEGEGPIKAKIGTMSIFPANKGMESRGGAQYDVVKMDVDSPDLHRLNAKLKKLPNGNTFPEYKPHITLAYVKAGEGKKYAGRAVPGLSGQEVTFDAVTFSPKSGEKTQIPLKAKETSAKDAFKMKGPELKALAGKGDAGAKAEIERRLAKNGKAPAKAEEPQSLAGPIPSGSWMNQWDIQEAADRYKKHPVLGKAAKFLQDFQEEVNSNSDGWPYWKQPAQAATQLMGLIQHPEYATEENLNRALGPIRSFYTRRGTAAGMKFPEISLQAPSKTKAPAQEGEKKPVTPQIVPEKKPEPLSSTGQEPEKAETKGAPQEKALEEQAKPQPAKTEPTIEPAGESHANTPAGEDQETLAGVPPENVSGTPEERETPGSDQERGPTNGGRIRAGGGAGTSARPSEGTDEGDVGVSPGGERPTTPRREPSKSQRIRAGEDYHITDADHLGEGGVKQKAADNIEAIRTLKRIEGENRPATPDEQKVLAKYVGWGGMPQIFQQSWQIPRDWTGIRADLEGLLDEKEFESARASTPNAHYTSATVINGMWDAVKRLGLMPEGGLITTLEPAVGSGNFYGLMPEGTKAQRVGVELDSVTGRIAKLLYPQADIHVAGFETIRLPNDYFDLAISNVPFGNYPVHDPTYKKTPAVTKSIHDYFFAKALDKVRPGGVVAFITSSYTMDKQDPYIRKYLADRADLIGAIRLPNTTFKGNAGTEVTTDIIFLQKRAEGQKPAGEAWTTLKPVQGSRKRPDGSMGPVEIHVNEYYADHPEMMLGKMALTGTMYASDTPTLEGDLTKEKLAGAVDNLPKDIVKPWEAPTQAFESVSSIPGTGEVKDGAYTVKDGQLLVRKGDQLRPVEVGVEQAKRIRGQISIRNAMHEVFRTQRDESSEPEITAAMKKLGATYDAFTKANGPLHKRENAKAFADDPDAAPLLALENWDKETGKATKSDIFTKRVIDKTKPAERADNAKDALGLVLNEKGRIDWSRMQELTGNTPEEMQEELGPLVFQNPAGKAWEPADEYLSGNVRKKLADAEAAAKMDKKFEKNVEALKVVQPQDLTPVEIDVPLGAPWIPTDDVRQFISEVLDMPLRTVAVAHNGALATWAVNVRNKDTVANKTTYGTARYYGHELLEDAMNLRSPTVYDTVGSGADAKRVINDKETLAARETQKTIKDKFAEWVWENPERATRLAESYNTEHNSDRLWQPDGSHLTFPGMAVGLKLRPHQKNGVWRIIRGDGNVLLAHVVGSGKTLEIVAASMELRRLGRSRKPMVVVPKNRVEGTAEEWMRAYPAANILTVGGEDFDPSKRQETMARIATGNWDGVIVAGEPFQKLPVSDETFNEFLQSQIDNLENYIREAKGDKADARIVKELEKSKKRLETKIRDTAKRDTKDKGLNFEDLGVDALFVDEADRYKNLQFPTKMTRISGIPNTQSDRAFDMFIKSQYIAKRNGGRGIVFATGTPVANSMAEVWTMQRYLQPKYLMDHGLEHFDAWAQTFGQVNPALEITPDGSGVRVTNKFNEFVNAPELIRGFRRMADVQTAKMLKLPVPALKGGKPTIVSAKASEEQLGYLKKLAQRAKDVKGKKPTKGADNILVVQTDGQKAAIDMRLVEPFQPDNPDSKVNAAIQRIYKIWKDTAKDKSTQLVFLDLSTPKKKGDKRFSVYEDMKDKLIAHGVPANEIAFMQNFKSDDDKEGLFANVNKGRVRILFGSTEAMGVGVNVQKKLIAMHQMDAPYRPRDVEQREGRMIRQGNENQEVEIFRYVTEPSFDARKWDILQGKASYIEPFMEGNITVRRMRDISDAELGYGEIAAIASGNPAIREKVMVDTEIRKLDAMRSRFEQQKYTIGRELHNLPMFIKKDQEDMAKAEADIATRDANESTFTIGKKEFTGKDARKEAALALGTMLDKRRSGKATTFGPDTFQIGKYRGFNLVGADWSSTDGVRKEADIVIQGELHYKSQHFYGDDSAEEIGEGLIRSIEGKVRNIESVRDAKQRDIDTNEKKLADTKAIAGKKFEQDDKLKALLARQAELEKILQTNVPDASTIGSADDEAVEGPEEESDSSTGIEKNEGERGSLSITNPRKSLEEHLAATGAPKALTEQTKGARTQALETLKSAMDEESDKHFGEKVRTFVTGERDVIVAETNQLRDALKDYVPNHLDQEAISLMRDFKNHPEELEQFLDGTHPFYDELPEDDREAAVERVQALEPAIQKALHPTDEMGVADQTLTQYFTKGLAQGRKLGFLDSEIGNEEYIPHLFEPASKAPAQSLIGRLFRGRLGPRNFKFAKHRHYPTILHAVAAGTKVKSMNALDALGVYGEKYATTAAYHLLLKALKKSGVGKWGSFSDQKDGEIPHDWVQLSPESRIFQNDVPFLTDDGKAKMAHQTLFVPKELEEALRPILDPNYLNRVAGFRQGRTYQGYIKSVELGLSVFHLKALNITALGSMGPDGMMETFLSDMDSPEFRAAELAWIRAGMTTPVLDKTAEVYRALQPTSIPTTIDKIRSAPGIKQIDQVAGAISHLTFGITQRKFKVVDASIKYAAWLSKHPDATPTESFDAQRQIAKQINATYGGLNWENMGVHRTSQELSKALLLAPDWMFSNWAMGKYAFEGGAGGAAARMFWLKSLFWGMALSAGLSLLIGGKRSKDPTRVNLGKDKEGNDITDNVFFVGATGDLSTMIHDVIKYGGVVGMARAIGSKFGPFARTGVHLMSNQDAMGRQIIPKKTSVNLLGKPVARHEPGVMEKTGLGAEDVLREMAPIPFSVGTIAGMLTDTKHHYTKTQYAEAALSGRRPQATK